MIYIIFDSLKGGGDKYNINLIINRTSIKNSDNNITKKLFTQKRKILPLPNYIRIRKKQNNNFLT